ncbi:hypothetical protein DFR28_1187, partial [Arenicella xantha]
PEMKASQNMLSSSAPLQFVAVKLMTYPET